MNSLENMNNYDEKPVIQKNRKKPKNCLLLKLK